MAGGGDEVKLLGQWASLYVARAKLALHLKGVTYHYVEEDLRSKSHLLLASNPVNKTVPVLIHNGNPITESQIIVQYIDEAFSAGGDGPALLPADPHDRAVARFWAAYVDHEMGAPWEKAFRARTEEERAEWMEKTVTAAGALEGGLRECSRGKPFFGGDAVGYVDVVLGALAPLLHGSEALFGVKVVDGARVPLLAAWLQRFGELDAAKAVLPDVDALVEYSRMILAKNAGEGRP